MVVNIIIKNRIFTHAYTYTYTYMHRCICICTHTIKCIILIINVIMHDAILSFLGYNFKHLGCYGNRQRPDRRHEGGGTGGGSGSVRIVISLHGRCGAPGGWRLERFQFGQVVGFWPRQFT